MGFRRIVIPLHFFEHGLFGKPVPTFRDHAFFEHDLFRKLVSIFRDHALARSHACAAFLLLAERAIGFWPSGRCCLADTIALDFPASDFPPKSGLWRVSQNCTRCACSAVVSSLTSGMTQ